MNKISENSQLHDKAKEQLANISKNRSNVFVIHYSCESFYDLSNETSPRITSIAVRNFATGHTESFSIHRIAERDEELSIKDISTRADELEKKMLEQFYSYAKRHSNYTWLHWNMRDSKYGFPALEHRYEVLGGELFKIQESRRHNLTELLKQLYGDDYIGHPRLKNLIRKNAITDQDFLSGEEEARAFENGEYIEVHQSTLRKVTVISEIANRASAGTLKTDVQLTENPNGSFFIRAIKNRFAKRLHTVGSITSIISWIQGC